MGHGVCGEYTPANIRDKILFTKRTMTIAI
jgi:hypothetical protein